MATLLVTYDLNQPGQNYSKLLAAIKAYPGWARLSESSYAISTSYGPQAVFDNLAQYLDRTDNLYVVTLQRPYGGRGPQKVNDWLAANL